MKPLITFPIPKTLNIRATLKTLATRFRGNVSDEKTIARDNTRRLSDYERQTQALFSELERIGRERKIYAPRYDEILRARVELKARQDALRKDERSLDVEERAAKRRIFEMLLKRAALEDPKVTVVGGQVALRKSK